ncbi:MAG TPA: hypothetical protein DDW31_02065 [candidate division Zixibacteria bacterium]|jgi:hypothetical protein|nr:hypothetical protein [candidate division Zixibacteria bacterium]
MDSINAQEELAFIRKAIADGRRVAVDNGLDYIVWGSLVSLGMFATIALELAGVKGNAYLFLWVAVMGSGWVFSLLRHLREKSSERVRTMAGSILNALWLSCGLVIMLLIFVAGPLMGQSPSPAIAAVLGIGYLVSGVLLDFVYFKVSAVFWWLGSAVMFYLESPWGRPISSNFHADILLFAVMMILFQVVPGAILYRRWRREMGGN